MMNILRKIPAAPLVIVVLVNVMAAAPAVAKDKPKAAAKEQAKDQAKELSGISIVGNKDAPKSLFIVPWKSSELGVETGLASSLLNEDLNAVDKDVFGRELDFYSITAVE